MTIAFIFPGQGSQSVGMLDAMAQRFPRVKETFDEAGHILDRDLWDVVQNGPEETLNDTRVTQPAMLAAGVAVWRVWQEQGGGTPVFMAGHSLGEITALVCAGSLVFEEAVSLVKQRAELMQSAVPAGVGAMAAILGLDDDLVRAACDEAAGNEVVQAANFNAIGQVVVAGHKQAVERAVTIAKEKGAKRAVILPVSVPSHCALMQPAAEQFYQLLQETTILSPQIPVVHNVDVSVHRDPDDIRNALAQQLHQPVRWVETIQTFAEQGVDHLIECGPGKVLVGLTKRIDKRMTAQPLIDPETVASALSD